MNDNVSENNILMKYHDAQYNTYFEIQHRPKTLLQHDFK